MSLAFPPEFFTLTLTFARHIAPHFSLSFEDALFSYTPVYVRTIGFDEEIPPAKTNKLWQKIVTHLPKSTEEQGLYIYHLYETFEKNDTEESNQVHFGCFSYFYHEKLNQFELHFTNNDPKGNLGKERILVRKEELKQLSHSIQSSGKKGATIHAHSWLLNTEAFTRLFPPAFIKTKQPWNSPFANDNTHWGQFVDRNGNLKKDLAEELLKRAEVKRPTIHEYFPIKPYFCESPADTFFDYYLSLPPIVSRIDAAKM